MGRKAVDLTGQRFGKWMVIERDYSIKKVNAYWKCECECGTLKSISGMNLRNGTSLSCGCANYNRRSVDLVGKEFGKLKVLRKSDVMISGQSAWIVQCECGNIREMSLNNLKGSKSCGCSRTPESLINMKFGNLTVIEKCSREEDVRHGAYSWLCRCKCGNEIIVRHKILLKGNKLSCGCEHDLTDKKFGRWTAIKKVESRNYSSYYLCECECGVYKEVASSDLLLGNSGSCGCLRIENYLNDLEDLTGKRFTRLTVLKQSESKNNKRMWECICDCGNKTIVSTRNLKSNSNGTKSCGCLHTDYLKQNKGKNHSSYKGTNSLRIFLRDRIKEWKKESMENCQFKCIISNKNFDVIHHIHPFHKILEEVLEITKLPIYSEIDKYTSEELETLSELCIELHYKYGLGVCLTKEIHNEFHKIYGNRLFTEQDFYEFYKDKTGTELNRSFLFAQNKEVVS